MTQNVMDKALGAASRATGTSAAYGTSNSDSSTHILADNLVACLCYA